MAIQKNIFLESEGDSWYQRNLQSISSRSKEDDSIYKIIQEIVSLKDSELKVLEIGCSNGYRLGWIKEYLNLDVYGIDPSKVAIEEGVLQGLNLTQGTADNLPYNDNFFDIVILGFCLYLCDRKDLFKIAYEVDRVLKNQSYLIIFDFYSKLPYSNPYVHNSNINS